jgi:hypothetical protein
VVVVPVAAREGAVVLVSLQTLSAYGPGSIVLAYLIRPMVMPHSVVVLGQLAVARMVVRLGPFAVPARVCRKMLSHC